MNMESKTFTQKLYGEKTKLKELLKCQHIDHTRYNIHKKLCYLWWNSDSDYYKMKRLLLILFGLEVCPLMITDLRSFDSV